MAFTAMRHILNYISPMGHGTGNAMQARKGRPTGLVVMLAWLMAIAPVHGQVSRQIPSTLRVEVAGPPTPNLNRIALGSMPRTGIATPAVRHVPAAHWRGVALEDILRRAGVSTGESLRGRAMSALVRIVAADHYQVAFSLGELDPYLGHEHVLLADTQDGHPLQGDSPFPLIVPATNGPHAGSAT